MIGKGCLVLMRRTHLFDYSGTVNIRSHTTDARVLQVEMVLGSSGTEVLDVLKAAQQRAALHPVGCKETDASDHYSQDPGCSGYDDLGQDCHYPYEAEWEGVYPRLWNVLIVL